MVWNLLFKALGETLYMVGISLVLAAFFGIPLGILLVISGPRHIKPLTVVHRVLSVIINVGRSLPFIILLVAIIPLTRFLVGTSIGTAGAIVPLTVSAIPFMARVVESALLEIDWGVIEAAQAMGATTVQIITKVLLPEAVPGLVLGVTMVAVSLISYSAMAGAVGGGGLGDLAIRYGYQRFRGDIMIITVLVLVAMVQGLQSLGGWLSERLNRK
ncbi:MAG TPA: methionine ABC transporter permease [Firmicutes bacterium]|jgi:D-methionine transport system permease protein|nr:methionine ABC transporter permease [Bacillota bacterium]HBK67485.1 methionine ABC transporter permease [Bacillota bacterium]HBT16307.1 methionine ABC transporter permease [Bacillota bacterium]